MANHLLDNPSVHALDEVPPRTVALDLSFLRSLGVANQLDGWRRLASAAVDGTSRTPKLAARA